MCSVGSLKKKGLCKNTYCTMAGLKQRPGKAAVKANFQEWWKQMGTQLIWLWYSDKSMFTEFKDGGSRGKKSEPDVALMLEFYRGELNLSGKNTIFRLLRYDNRLCTMQ